MAKKEKTMYIFIIAALWHGIYTGIITDTYTAHAQAANPIVEPLSCIPNPEYKIQLISVEDNQHYPGADYPKRFTDKKITQMVANANWNLRASSDTVFAYQQFNFANTNCVLDVMHIEVSDIHAYTTSMDIANVILTQFGLNDPKTKYVVLDPFLNFNCGLAQISLDDRPGPENKNNQSSWAEMSGCGDGRVLSHELFHMLGAVNLSAPHSNGHAHCIDAEDIMCYSEHDVVTQEICPQYGLYDCNHDDYYSLVPPTGSYLATHWNVANSKYLTTYKGILLPLIFNNARMPSNVEQVLSERRHF